MPYHCIVPFLFALKGSKMKVIPTQFTALIMPDSVEEKSDSGRLFLPDTARTRLQYAVDRGKIIAVGEGFYSDRPGPKPEVGQKVIFDRYAGSLINIEENGQRTDYRLVNDDKIIAILEE